MIIIDGHNLIGSMPMIGLDDPNCKDKLLELLEKYQCIIDERIIIIFDGTDFLNREEYQRNGIEICYPSKNLDADYVIKKLINKYKNNLNIKLITSDNELKSLGKKRGLTTIQSRKFTYEILDTISHYQADTEKFLAAINTEEWLEYFNK